jgi:hypothetical protein
VWPPDDEDFWTAPRAGEPPYRPGLLEEPEADEIEPMTDTKGDE